MESRFGAGVRRALAGRRLVALLLTVLALALVALIVHDVIVPAGSSLGATRTTVVRRGTVSSAVAGTGTVVPVQQQNVGFRVAGVLTEVDVKVGYRVTDSVTVSVGYSFLYISNVARPGNLIDLGTTPPSAGVTTA